MPRLRLLIVVMIGTVALSLSACDDPTSVGLDIIGDRGGTPQVHDLPPLDLSASHVPQVTGNNERTLLGYLDDPLLGTARGHAYVDFATPIGAGDFHNGTVDHAAVLLDRDYIVGDTTGNFTITLYDMADDWNPQGATADTSFARSSPISSYTVSATDTLVTLELPSDWVARNDTTLRSPAFSNVFHGFYFEATQGNAVIGFTPDGTFLRAAAGADTALFAMAKNLTAIEHEAPQDLPPDRVIVQGTGGRALETIFDMEELRNDFALNRATLRVREDSLASAANTPHGHIRPRASQLNLFVRLEDGTLVQVDAAFRDDDGVFSFGSSDFRTLINSYLSGVIDIDALVLRVPTTVNSLDHLLVHTDVPDEPRLTLTLTPLLD